MVENKISNEMISTINDLLRINKIKKIALSEIKFNKKIGEGGQAQVYKGFLENDIPVAVKILSEIDMKCLAHEIVISSNLNHPNIPKFYGIILEENVIGMVSEYIFGKSLDEIQKELSETEKINIAKSICSALAYVHSINFIHRDLKPENVLIEEKEKKAYLIDFGIAKVITTPDAEATLTRAKGTIYYLAPEVFEIEDLTDNKEIISFVTTKVDVWAFGCIIFYLFSGILPWVNRYKNSPTVIQKLLMKKEKFPIGTSITNQEIAKIIKLATDTDFESRATMNDLLKIFESL